MNYDLSDARLERVSIASSYEASLVEYTRVDQWQILSLKIHLADKYKLLSYSPPQTRLRQANGLVVIQLPRLNNPSLCGVAQVETPHGSNLLVSWGRVAATMSDGESQQQGFMGCESIEMAQGPSEHDKATIDHFCAAMAAHVANRHLKRGQEISNPTHSSVWIEEREVLGHLDCDLYIGF